MFHSKKVKEAALSNAIEQQGWGGGVLMGSEAALANATFEAGYALGRTPSRIFTAEEFKKIQHVLEDGRWNWGGFAVAMGQLLRKSDFGNAQKLANGFENEFLGWLDCYGR